MRFPRRSAAYAIALLVGTLTIGAAIGALSTAPIGVADATTITRAAAPEQRTDEASPVYLPVLRPLDGEDQCDVTLTVTNRGDGPAVAVMLVWGQPGFCPPQCAGPLEVVCSGLIAPGGMWQLPGSGEDEFPAGAWSAAAYTLDGELRLSDVGLAPDPGEDELVADYLCDVLRAGTVGDCDDARRFQLAYDAGSFFADVPLGEVYGPTLEVNVTRDCASEQNADERVTAAYTGQPTAALGTFDTELQAWVYSVPLVRADYEGHSAVINVQNVGTSCATIDMGFVDDARDWPAELDVCPEREGCGFPTPEGFELTDIIALGSGEAFGYAVTDCIRERWRGSVWLRSTTPLAIAVDDIAADALHTYPAVPGPRPFDLDGDGDVDDDDLALVEAAQGTTADDPNWEPRLDVVPDGVIDDEDRALIDANAEVNCPQLEPLPTPEAPEVEAARPGFLPMVSFQGNQEACNAWIKVYNPGPVPARAILAAFPDRGLTCDAPCAGPIGIECSGLIPPGGDWNFVGAQVPRETRDAVVFSLRSGRLSEFGIEAEIDDVMADFVCERLFRTTPGECDLFAAFLTAYEAGAVWTPDRSDLSIPLDRAVGPALEVELLRMCPDPVRLGENTVDHYASVGDAERGLPHAGGDFLYHTRHVFTGDPDERGAPRSLLYIQNTATTCTTVEVWLRTDGSCDLNTHCTTLALNPQAAASMAVDSCTDPGWTGTVWLRADGPLALGVETIGEGLMALHVGRPGPIPYDLDGDGDVDADDAALVEAAVGTTRDDPGWDPRLDLDADGDVDMDDVGLVGDNACGSVPVPTVPPPPTATPEATATATAVPGGDVYLPYGGVGR